MNTDKDALLPKIRVTTTSERSISPITKSTCHKIHFFPEYESYEDPGHHNVCPCLSQVPCCTLL